MTQPILAPIDGSESANAALDLAADIAAKTGAALTILHVGLREPGPVEARYAAAERAFEEAQEAGRRTSAHPEWPRHLQVLEHMGHMILDEAKARAEAKGAANVETTIDWGEAGERILHHAKHPPCGMIVIGSRGASAMEGALMGSVSHKVLHLAPCSCVTVHARAGQSGLGQVKRILVPYDGSDPSKKALALACDLAKTFGAGLKLLHVLGYEGPPERLRKAVDVERLDAETKRALEEAEAVAGAVTAGMVGLPPMIPDEAMRKIGEEILASAKRAAADRGVDEVDGVLLDGDPAQLVVATAKEDKADLLVMGMRGLGELEGLLLGSVSYKVNHRAPCTCITVR